jgi:transposase-like protein
VNPRDQPAAGGKPGRKPIYDYTFPKRAHKMTLLGATLDDMAEAFGVSPNTIDNWMQDHEEFAAAVRAARIEADANVAHSLYRRALGYTHREDKIFSHAANKFDEARVVRVRTRRHYPPDTTAAIHWLATRRRVKGDWQPPKSQHELGGIAGGTPLGMRDETKAELIASILNLIKPKPDKPREST